MDKREPQKAIGNLLIVEDDLSARQTMEAFLTREGYEVRCAPNGQTALMFAQEDPPELVLLDIRLPDMDGFEVCRRLKEGLPRCETEGDAASAQWGFSSWRLWFSFVG